MNYEKIILVTRQTRLEGLIQRFNTKAQARFYIQQSGGNFHIFEQEHETYYKAVHEIQKRLQVILKVQTIERSFLPTFLFTEKDLVVTIGIDGLVVNTAKYLNGQPLIAVNPDPIHIDGILLPFTVNQISSVLETVLKGQHRIRTITMAEVQLNDGQRLRAFNDLFIGTKSHTSARYQIKLGKQLEKQSSSGIIVSTGAGSTGWMSSIMHMANGLIRQFGSSTHSIQPVPLSWEDEKLIFAVREPFVSKVSGASIVCDYITSHQPLVIESEMPEAGVIFSDGVEADFLEFNAGSIATISLSQVKTNLVVP